MSTDMQKSPSWAKRLTFILCLGLMVVMCTVLISYRLALSYAYKQFSRADLSLPSDLAAQVAQASTDGKVLQRGEHLIRLMGCTDCHGEDLAGQVLIDTPAVRISAPNLTHRAQANHLERRYAALRLGLDEDHRALWLMPRQALLALTHGDLVALLATLDRLTPKPHTLPVNRLSGSGYRALLTGDLVLVDKTTPAPPAGGWPTGLPEQDSLEAGEYLLTAGRCVTCHATQKAKFFAPGGQVGLALQGHDLTIELGMPKLEQKPEAQLLYSQLKYDARVLPLIKRMKHGRCPDDRSPQERGGPSRMATWTEEEAGSALAAWRVRLAITGSSARPPRAQP